MDKFKRLVRDVVKFEIEIIASLHHALNQADQLLGALESYYTKNKKRKKKRAGKTIKETK